MSVSDPSLDLRQWVREIPDFPKPGILFRDLTPLMRDPQGWQETVRRLGVQCEQWQPDLIVGIESRGFIVGMALATALRLPFAPVRKPGKLPGEVHGVDYTLEYGQDRLEIHADGFEDQPRVLIVDDLLATGGTAAACGQLVELSALNGRDKLPERVPAESLIVY